MFERAGLAVEAVQGRKHLRLYHGDEMVFSLHNGSKTSPREMKSARAAVNKLLRGEDILYDPTGRNKHR